MGPLKRWLLKRKTRKRAKLLRKKYSHLKEKLDFPWVKFKGGEIQMIGLPHGKLAIKPGAKLKQQMASLQIKDNEPVFLESYSVKKKTAWDNFELPVLKRAIPLEAPYALPLFKMLFAKFPDVFNQPTEKRKRFSMANLRARLDSLKPSVRKMMARPQLTIGQKLAAMEESLKSGKNDPAMAKMKAKKEVFRTYISLFRSYLMAEMMRHYLEANPSGRARLFVGAGHTEAIGIFLKSPRIRKKYFKLLPDFAKEFASALLPEKTLPLLKPGA